MPNFIHIQCYFIQIIEEQAVAALRPRQIVYYNAPLSGSRAFGGQRKPAGAGCGCLAVGSTLCPTAQSIATAAKL